LISCDTPGPLGINDTVLNVPSSNPTFSHELIRDADGFGVGYLNGSVRPEVITLEWSQNNDDEFLYYRIFRDNNQLADFTNRSTTSYTDDNLAPDTEYFYRISATLIDGRNLTDTITVKTPLFDAPTSAGIQVATVNSVRLYFRNNSEVAHSFTISRKLDWEPEDEYGVVEAGITDTTYLDTGLSNGSTYDYRIFAYSDYDTTATYYFTPVLVEYDLDAPFNLEVDQIAPTSDIELSWTDASSSELYFQIYRRQGNDDFEEVATVPTDVSTWIDSDSHSPGYFFSYRITAVDGDGVESDYVSESTYINSYYIWETGFEDAIPADFTMGNGWGWYLDVYELMDEGQFIRNYASTNTTETLSMTLDLPFPYTVIHISFYHRGGDDGVGSFVINGDNELNWGYDILGDQWQEFATDFYPSGDTTLDMEWAYDTQQNGYGALDDIQIYWEE